MASPAPPPSPSQLLRLPRELRDEVYNSLLQFPFPLPIKTSHFHRIPPTLWKDPTLHAEALESFYKLNTFVMNLEASEEGNLADCWGPWPQSKQHIRHLIVSCDSRYSSITDFEEYERTKWFSHDRRRWAQFLEVPHLESLTINMQKAHDTSLFTLDFAPILYRLRDLRPNIILKFKISFDSILQASWNDPWWQQFNPQPINTYVSGPAQDVPERYEPMGFIDVSDLIEPPSEGDQKYVKETLGHRTMPTTRYVTSGLLSETPANRRALGRFYVVKESELLRVLMAEQYEVWKACKKGRAEKAEAGGDAR